ncbi:ABC transporter substrate-binding protein [Devosia sp. BK]|uniref:ABC transporter substrate-binding protein n=1 Tax=Devosia sp. BK TaxID=2871706 RepID=UPI002939FC5F|nr:ABC transporter substrate-binding protein [Devosia sp. BK]MDV3251146.1 ABC transporter substrate-binding protein [Devosia sp. BK]
MLFRPIALASLMVLALSSAAHAEPWTYTDGTGQSVTLDAVPQRIIASQDAAAGLIPLGIRPVGIYADSPVDAAKALEGLDLTGIEIIGQAWGEVDIEKAAALEPDLVLAEWWDRNSTWSGGEDVVATLSQLAPITGVSAGDSIVGMIEDYETLAQSLGADLSAPAIAENKAAFETALADFKTAIEAKPGLTALAVYAGDDALYVADPAGAAELLDMQSWGLTIVKPEGVDAAGNNYFETVSWENADRYPADLILVDNRAESTLATALAQPTWTLMKAAEAGQVAEWPAFWLRNYKAYAGALTDLTAAINAADPDLTP